MPPAKIEIQGQKFGRWTVIEYVGKQRWACRCDCGTEQNVLSANLRYGKTHSCGCLCSEMATVQMTTHGQSIAGERTPEYRAWTSAKFRCRNPNHKCWKYYGALGVDMCDEWAASFEAFLAYVGKRPSAAYSLDRFPDCDGDYEPGNVRWATRLQQVRNRRNSITVVIDGETLSLREISQKYNVKYQDVANRIKRGWTPAAAIGLAEA